MLKIHWERWKTWKEHPEYKVSSDGRVKLKGKEVHLKINDGGYMLLDLGPEYGNYADRYYPMHRLVCHVFRGLDMKDSNLTVDHLNHNKRDNSLRNLELVSAKENQKRAKEDFVSGTASDAGTITPAAIFDAVERVFGYEKFYIKSADGQLHLIDSYDTLVKFNLISEKESPVAQKNRAKSFATTVLGMYTKDNTQKIIFKKREIIHESNINKTSIKEPFVDDLFIGPAALA